MNKDVIYIEPEDDITDIITKIGNAKEKIVALVPPKKPAVLRSVVNIKLIHKAGFTADKTIVLVTEDPAIMKLAATVKMPVTKDLQSAPSVPSVFEGEEEAVSTEEVVETDENGKEVEEKVEEVKKEADSEASEVEVDKDTEDVVGVDKNEEKLDKKEKKDKKPGKFANNKAISWVLNHKKIAIASGIGAVVLILVLVWAFAIAPAATVTVGVRTTTGNFSENVTFTTNLEEENSAEGKFYLTEKKNETKVEVEFEATGEKNIGDKASGNLLIYTYFQGKGSVSVPAGTKFTTGDLTYVSDSAATLSWDGTTLSDCGDLSAGESISDGCRISKRITITATEGGTKYNLNSATSSWKSSTGVLVAMDGAISGGTDNIVTVVQQSDIDKALSEIKTENEAVNKQQLLDTVIDGEFAIEASFKQTTSDPVSTPTLGEQVKEGEKAKLSVTTTDTLYVIDETKVKEFITEKAKLAENYKIYEMKEPFIENFVNTESGYIGKLKTSYVSGPKVTEDDIVALVRGKGLGEASKNITSSIDGVSEVHIDPSFPWVYSIPNDPNKITVVINVKD